MPTILVVDDNEANRALACGTLEDEGYRVVLAGGGAEGIAAFEAHHPDCILLDVRMPHVDGFAACEAIRAAPGGREVPIIFLTALRDVDTFDRAQRAGADDFLGKPVRPNELLARVESALKLRSLRSELSGRYALLKKQRDDLMRLQLQKERLSAFLIHDLKNPVNSMDLHAQVLLRDPDLPASARASASQIRAEARRLTRMILNLLDLSKGDEGKLVAKRLAVEVDRLVRDVFAELGPAAEARHVRLDSRLEVSNVSADEELLLRLIANLVENAIRHAPADSTVRVDTVRVDEGVLLRVSDEGPGVPAQMVARIFDPFVQVEGTKEQAVTRAGRGLGLAFCKVAAEVHGGRIWVETWTPNATVAEGDLRSARATVAGGASRSAPAGGPATEGSSAKGPGAAFCVFLKDP